jgi:asparagine synthase (glutamine-hydrolysing)
MRETLHHRGPDGEGLFVSPDRRVGLAHRRLAIVDIAGGAQPMFGPGGTCLVFNGEIYNYPALRGELEREGVVFETNCDTEVILHLYRRHGDACVEHLTGMFAFALWDPDRRQLLLARDPIGEKPLYWAERSGVLVFGSEIKALLEHPLVEREVNVDAIGPYLAHLVSPAPETLYRGINKLPAGCIARVGEAGVEVARYRRPVPPREVRDVPEAEAAARVRELLVESVQARLMADVPLGVLLSGGVDSTTIVGLLAESTPDLDTYTVGFPGHGRYDESDEARWVSRHFGTRHHEIVLSEDAAVASFPALVHHQDEPLADATTLPLRAICDHARDVGTKVLLAGEGADELFWGYDGFPRTIERWPRLNAMLRMPGLVRRAAARATSVERHAQRRERLEGIAEGRVRALHMPLGLTAGQRARLILDANADAGWGPGAAAEEDSLLTFAFDTQEHEFQVRLPELLLQRTDRFSMAASIEARVPFLDPGLVDYVYGLPIDFKVRDGVKKRILKLAVSDVLPERIANRPKQGFTPPMSRWFDGRNGTVLRELCGHDTLRRYFDVDYLRRVLDTANPDSWESGHFLWPVLNFGLWHRYWIEGEQLEDLVGSAEAEPVASVAA